MAIRLGDVFVALTADAKGLDKGLNDAQKKTTNWATGLASNVTKLVGGALVAGVGAATAAVAGIGVAAFKASSDFDAATKKMQASLGATDEQAAEFRDSIENLFKNNWGTDINDVAQSLTTIRMGFERIGGAGKEEIEQATAAAIALRDTYGVDVAESTEAAIELMSKFGITSEQAFGFITKGYQQGLNASDDFLDSITEYSTQFSNGGADATQFFRLLQTGLQAGALGTDKAADAFKEFRIRIGDGSQLTSDGLKMLGLNADEFIRKLSTGAMTSIDAFDIVLQKLREIEDPNLRLQAGVALLGTQYEDLGDSAVAYLSTAAFAVEEFEGTIDSLNKQYNTIPSFLEGLRRRAIVAISPLGDAMLKVANEALPAIEAAFTSLETAVTNFIANSSFTWEPDFKQVKLGDLFDFISNDTLTYINLGEYVSFVYNKEDGAIDLKIGDLFSLSANESGTQINLADYLTFIYDNPSGALALKLGDVFTFVSDSQGSVINLADYVTFTYKPNEKIKVTVKDIVEFDADAKEDRSTFKLDLASFIAFTSPVTSATLFNLSQAPATFKLSLGDFFSWVTGQEKTTTDDLFDLSAKPAPSPYQLRDFFDWMTGTENQAAKITYGDLFSFEFDTEKNFAKIKIGDLFEFGGQSGEGTINLANFLKINFDPSGITKLKLGDLIDVSDTGTLRATVGEALSQAASAIGEALKAPAWLQSLIDWKVPTEVPAWLSNLLSWSWPSLSESASTTIDSLVAWKWPDVPASLDELLTWVWPDAPKTIDELLAWLWPDFSEGLMSAINSIIAFQWPQFERPRFLDDLLSFSFPAPSWLNNLLSFQWPDLNIPDWLADLFGVNGASVVGASVGGNQPVAPVVTIGPVYVRSEQDIESLAYRVAARLAAM